VGAGEGQVLQLTAGPEVVVRPIAPDDASLLQAFVRRLSTRSRRFRFFVALAEWSAAELDRFVNVDPARGLALVARFWRLSGAEACDDCSARSRATIARCNATVARALELDFNDHVERSAT
jgi:hypothetical protein